MFEEKVTMERYKKGLREIEKEEDYILNRVRTLEDDRNGNYKVLLEKHNRLLDHLGLEEKTLSGTELVIKEDL